MADTDDERHRYGQHYTPDAVARLLAAFAVRRASDVVLDPSCGDGRLLEAARSAKRALASAPLKSPRPGGKGTAHARSPDNLSRVAHELFGIDRSAQAVVEA